MRLRRLLAPVLLVAAAPLLALPSANAVGTPPNGTFYDTIGDGPPAVDIDTVRSTYTDGGFKVAVLYTDLAAKKGTRWSIRFQELAPSRPAAGAPVRSYGNLIELRIDPAGTMSTLSWVLRTDGTIKAKACRGIAATPSYSRSKITFFVPGTCWKSSTSRVEVLPAARRFPAGQWRTGVMAPFQAGDKADQGEYGWTWSVA